MYLPSAQWHLLYNNHWLSMYLGRRRPHRHMAALKIY